MARRLTSSLALLLCASAAVPAASAPAPGGTIVAYYRALNAGQYASAYSLLDPFRRPPYGRWAAGYAGTARVMIVALADPGYRLAAHGATYTCVTASLDSRDRKGKHSSYAGWYLMRYTPQTGWRMMVPGTLFVVAPSPPAPSQRLCSTIIPQPSLSALDPFVGDWQGHGRLLVLGGAGQGIYRFRLYTDCGPKTPPPCDSVVQGMLHAGGYAAVIVTHVSGGSAYGTVADSAFRWQIGGSVRLTLAAHDTANLHLPGQVGEDILCGPRSPVGYCGA